jgi:cobalt-zinc-cadmium efflux system outer membrane protein
MFRVLIAFLIAAIALPRPLSAGEKEQMSLQQAIEQAVRINPQLKVGADRIGNFLGQEKQAGLKPNPRLVVQQENGRAWELSGASRGNIPGYVFFRDTDTYVYGGQLIERGGKRERRIEFAKAGVDRGRSERDAIEQQVRARVAMAYWTAASAAKIRDLYQENLQTFDRIVQDSQNRVSEGAAAGADLLRIQVERERLSASAQNAQLEADKARIALLREIGQRDYPDLVLTEAIDAPTHVPAEPIEQVFAQRGEVQVARAVVSQAESNVRLQHANAKVDPEVQLGYKRTSGYDTLYAAISTPLPFRNRNQGNIASAEADVRTAESSLTAIEQQIQAEVVMAQRDYESKQRILTQTLRPLVVKSDESLRITLAAYREGGFDLIRYLDAQRVRIEAQTLFYQGLGQIHESAVALQQAQGDQL